MTGESGESMSNGFSIEIGKAISMSEMQKEGLTKCDLKVNFKIYESENPTSWFERKIMDAVKM